MNELQVLLDECISLTNEIYEMALTEEIYNVRNKNLLLINNLKKLFPELIKYDFSLNPSIVKKTEKLVEAINLRDCVTTMDIVKFELKPMLEEYLESIGEVNERE